MKKYYLAHKKVKKYIEFLYQVFQELFSFLFYGLVLEILENSLNVRNFLWGKIFFKFFMIALESPTSHYFHTDWGP